MNTLELRVYLQEDEAARAKDLFSDGSRQDLQALETHPQVFLLKSVDNLILRL